MSTNDLGYNLDQHIHKLPGSVKERKTVKEVHQVSFDEIDDVTLAQAKEKIESLIQEFGENANFEIKPITSGPPSRNYDPDDDSPVVTYYRMETDEEWKTRIKNYIDEYEKIKSYMNEIENQDNHEWKEYLRLKEKFET